MCLFLHSKDFSLFSAAFVFSAHSREKREMSGPTVRHMLDQTQLGLPKLTQIYGTPRTGQRTTGCHLNIKKPRKTSQAFF